MQVVYRQALRRGADKAGLVAARAQATEFARAVTWGAVVAPVGVTSARAFAEGDLTGEL